MVSSLLIKTERGGSSWAMRVNGTEISHQDFNREVAKQSNYLAQLRSQYGQYADLLFQSLGWSLDPKVRALDTLVKEELVNQYAASIGIFVHPDYIAKIINNAQFVRQNLGHIIPPFAYDQSGVLDINTLNAYVRQSGMSAQQFEQSVERALVQLQLMNCISTSSYTPIFDVKQEFITKNLGKKFSYLLFSLDQFLAEEKKKSISDQDLESFYNAQNTQLRRYWVPEKRTAFMWKFEPKNYNISISDQDIQNYYDDNKVKSYVLEPLKVEVQQITSKELGNLSDISFEDIRKELLNNTSSQWENKWKTLKPFARGEHKGELEKAAFVLQNEGDISPIFETNNGEQSIIRLVRRIPRTYKPLSLVKNEIKSILTQKAFKKHFVKDIKEIAAQGDQKAIESFIVNNAGKKELITNFAKNDTRLSQELFSLKKGEYAFYIENEVGVVLMLSNIAQRYLPDFNSIAEVVKGDFYEHNAHIALKEKAEQAILAAPTKKMNELAVMFNASLNSIDMISPTDEKALKDLDRKGLPVREMMNLEKEGSIFSYDTEKDSYLIRLDAVEAFDENQFQAVENDIKSHLGSIRTRLFLDAFVASLHRNATIETNESIITMDEEYSE